MNTEEVVRRIGVLTSRDNAPGIGATVWAVVRTSLCTGVECAGIHRGYHGLTNGDLTKLTFESVGGLSRRGGVMLYSVRSEEFKTPAGQEKVVATCKILGLDTLVGIGGGGTFSGLLCLAKREFSIVGISDTIGSDIAYSSCTIGYDATCSAVLESIDKLRDTMQSHEHCSVVGVTGHRAGHLTLTVGMACGAIAVIVPEHPMDYEAGLLEPIRRARLADRTYFMVVVAEDVEGGAYSIGKVIEEATALDTRVTVLGHIQRSGPLSSCDRIAVIYMGYEVMRPLAEGKTCWVVALQGKSYVDYDITEALQMTKSLGQHIYEIMRVLAGVR